MMGRPFCICAARGKAGSGARDCAPLPRRFMCLGYGPKVNAEGGAAVVPEAATDSQACWAKLGQNDTAAHLRRLCRVAGERLVRDDISSR